MKIIENDISHIEKALDLKLYEHQINYLLEEGDPQKEMQTGSESEKTVAYCIKLVLSEGKLLNLNKPEQFADNWSLQGEERLFYAKKVFRKKFISVWCKLHDYRFPVRDIFI